MNPWRKTLALAALLVAVAGCPTTREVTALVDESNAALLAAFDSSTEEAQAAVRNIDAFLAKTPGKSAATNGLVVRKAMLLLAVGNRQMALAAIGDYDTTIPTNETNRALKESFGVLAWWAKVGNGSAPASEYRTNLAALDGALATMSRGTGIYYHLLVTRANIQLKHTSLMGDRRSGYRDGLKAFCAGFSADDRKRIGLFLTAPEELRDEPPAQLRPLAMAKATRDIYTRDYQSWLDEVRAADPEDQPNEVVNVELEAKPSWDASCKWLTEPGSG